MTKPRVFIGSSVEGLKIAYPVQQNLLHEAEVTVWDQGVFQLSRTTIESLSKVLSESDFAIFVFSPDDLIQIRNLSAPAVRDNVLFEFGLFVGKLGRERVFFVLPTGGDLHIPSDLLGITPGRYESNRADGSMQAATGAVCHQISQQMKSLGGIPGRLGTELVGESAPTDTLAKRSWINDFFDDKYESARSKLEIEFQAQRGEDALCTRAWILFCELRQRHDDVIEPLVELANGHPESSRLLSLISMILRWEGHVARATDLLLAAQVRRPKDAVISTALASCYVDSADSATAIAELRRVGPEDFPDVAIELADMLESEERKGEALKVVQSCYAKHPSHRGLRFKYARLAQDLDLHAVALALFDGLTKDDEDSIEYWGYLGNSCLQLELNDRALISYRRAEKLTDRDASSQWIAANIGNLLSFKGFPTESCEYFEHALKNEPRSEYSHERFAVSIKRAAAEEEDFKEKVADGRRQIREAVAEASAPTAKPSATVSLIAGLVQIPPSAPGGGNA